MIPNALDYYLNAAQVIEKAKQAVAESGSNRARALVKNAVTLQERAWDYLRKRMYQQARRFRHGWTDVERSMEQLHQFLERGRDPIMKTGSEKNIEMFNRAERRFAQAQDALKDGQVSVAREHLKICRELLRRALVGIERSADPGQVKELIEKAQERWDQLEGAVIDSGDQGFRGMYRRAGKHLKRAQSMLRQKR